MNATTLKNLLNYDNIKKMYSKKGYAFFDSGEYNLNIGGIRITVDSNLFDDLIFCAYRVNGQPVVDIYSATTDPGIYWLKNPMNKRGTAILVPGQYRGTYQIGKHQGKYEALIQTGSSVKTFRDGDKDTKHDMDPATITNGFFGINIHRSNPFTESYNIDKWSAGCQVFANAADFTKFMKVVNKSAKLYSNKFTYTLFEVKDYA